MTVNVANRTREIRPSGMKTGAVGNVTVPGEEYHPKRDLETEAGGISKRAYVLSKHLGHGWPTISTEVATPRIF